jgi:flagellar basal-body rod protein FlgF
MQEIAVLASRVLTSQRQFTAVADNVANVNTAGFKKLELNFKEVLSKPVAAGPQAVGASYVADRALLINQRDGALTQTGNPLDVALSGRGFYAIDVNGTTQYTRRGNFLLNAEGQLVTPEGYALLDNAGAPIQIPQGSNNLRIANDGTISAEQGQIAQIGVYDFSARDMKLLQRAGNTAFVPTQGAAAQVVEAPMLRQGFVEASNVNAVEEMVNMETVSRAYQSSVSLLRGLEDLEQRAIRTLGNSN